MTVVVTEIFIVRSFPCTLTTLDYYPVVTSPINDPNTLQKILHMNALATQWVGQLYIITIFGEGVYQQLMPIL